MKKTQVILRSCATVFGVSFLSGLSAQTNPIMDLASLLTGLLIIICSICLIANIVYSLICHRIIAYFLLPLWLILSGMSGYALAIYIKPIPTSNSDLAARKLI